MRSQVSKAQAIIGAVLAGTLGATCGSTPSGSGPSGAAGTTGAGGTGGGSAPACRTYATGYTFMSSLGTMATYTCSHSETSGFDRTCMTSGFTSVEHWASRSDFVDEAAAVGVTHLASITTTATTTYEYDAQKRLQRILNSGALYATCDAWDAIGRCTHEVLAGTCAGAQSAISYGLHSVTFDTTGGACAARTTTTYDADGILASVDYGTGVTGTYTTTGRATVCR
jgi:hypothetical protein